MVGSLSLSLQLVMRVQLVRLLVVAVRVGRGRRLVSRVDRRRGLVGVRVRMEVEVVEQNRRVGAERRRWNLGRNRRAELGARPATLLSRVDGRGLDGLNGLNGLVQLQCGRLTQLMRLRLRLLLLLSLRPVSVILVLRVLIICVGEAGRARRARVVEVGVGRGRGRCVMLLVVTGRRSGHAARLLLQGHLLGGLDFALDARGRDARVRGRSRVRRRAGLLTSAGRDAA